MGHIKEPNGVTLVVEKQDLSPEVERKIKDFIKKSKAFQSKFQPVSRDFKSDFSISSICVSKLSPVILFTIE